MAEEKYNQVAHDAFVSLQKVYQMLPYDFQKGDFFAMLNQLNWLAEHFEISSCLICEDDILVGKNWDVHLCDQGCKDVYDMLKREKYHAVNMPRLIEHYKSVGKIIKTGFDFQPRDEYP